MKKSEIEAYIDRQQKLSDRAYMNYQETGDSRQLRSHERAEDQIEIARQALSAAEDHAAVGRMKAELVGIISQAIRIRHTNDSADGLLKDLESMASLYGVRNPYKEEMR